MSNQMIKYTLNKDLSFNIIDINSIIHKLYIESEQHFLPQIQIDWAWQSKQLDSF